MVGTKAIAIALAHPLKYGPFEIRSSKCLTFKCFRIRNGQISDPAKMMIPFFATFFAQRIRHFAEILRRSVVSFDVESDVGQSNVGDTEKGTRGQMSTRSSLSAVFKQKICELSTVSGK